MARYFFLAPHLIGRIGIRGIVRQALLAVGGEDRDGRAEAAGCEDGPPFRAVRLFGLDAPLARGPEDVEHQLAPVGREVRALRRGGSGVWVSTLRSVPSGRTVAISPPPTMTSAQQELNLARVKAILPPSGLKTGSYSWW